MDSKAAAPMSLFRFPNDISGGFLKLSTTLILSSLDCSAEVILLNESSKPK